MNDFKLVELAMVLILGISAQWIAWKARLPSILFLLIFGFIGGPVLKLINPDELLGELLHPFVSLSVAVILFEGGMSLKISELKEIGKVLTALITVGAMITWVTSTAAVYFLFGYSFGISVLIGTVLIVTGPTVIGPLLRYIKPNKRVGQILKWEGIIIDPIGALIAVLVFEAIMIGEFGTATPIILLTMLKTVVVGTACGVISAALLVFSLRKLWIPDFLQESAALLFVFAAFIVSEHFQSGAGLFAVTLMGVYLANQKYISIRNILKFKENLRIIIISVIFVLLSARLKPGDFNLLSSNIVWFLLVLIFIVRPLSVIVSTLRSSLNWNERFFIAFLAPRGIVAAAVASVFALQLSSSYYPEAAHLVPVTFIVIISTVVIYGLTARPLSRFLNVAQADPQGLIIVGAHGWAREIAAELQKENFKVVLVDTNKTNVIKAEEMGLKAYNRNILSENISDEIDLNGVGRILALTSNDEANSLAALAFLDVFEKHELYQLYTDSMTDSHHQYFSRRHLSGRFLFKEGLGFDSIEKLYKEKWKIRSAIVGVNSHFINDGNSIIFFLIKENGELLINTADSPAYPVKGDKIIIMAKNDEVLRNLSLDYLLNEVVE